MAWDIINAHKDGDYCPWCDFDNAVHVKGCRWPDAYDNAQAFLNEPADQQESDDE